MVTYRLEYRFKKYNNWYQSPTPFLLFIAMVSRLYHSGYTGSAYG